MDNDNLTLEQIDIDTDMLHELENSIPPSEHLPESHSQGSSESENLETNSLDSSVNYTEFEINEEILNVDCCVKYSEYCNCYFFA